jgi:hypothetical protein
VIQKKKKKIKFFQLKNVPGKLSFTIDGWTSPNVISFLGITCHYVDNDWQIQEVLLDFVSFTGPYSGENIAAVFAKSLQDMNILTKVSNFYSIFFFDYIIIYKL